jgi:hypothetical protein
MSKRPTINTGFRLPPATKRALRDLLRRLGRSQGHSVKQDDLVAVLIARAHASVQSQAELDMLGAEVRAQRIKAAKAGY